MYTSKPRYVIDKIPVSENQYIKVTLNYGDLTSKKFYLSIYPITVDGVMELTPMMEGRIVLLERVNRYSKARMEWWHNNVSKDMYMGLVEEVKEKMVSAI